MPKVSMQFHALPKETAAILNTVLEKMELKAYVMYETDGRINLIEYQNWHRPTVFESDIWVVISNKKIIQGDENWNQFLMNNRGCLFLTIAKHTETILGESGLSGILNEETKGLTKVVSIFKKSLERGAKAYNKEKTAIAFVPNHYFSKGAVDFENKNGIPKAFAGSNIYSFKKEQGGSVRSE